MPGLKLTEADVALACRRFLEAHGWRVHRLTADTYNGHRHKRHEKVEAGTPDYICVRGKWPFYLETKRPGAKLRPTQKAWFEGLNSGIELCVADSYESFKAWYEEHFG